jgi:hypothetical protein
MSRDDQQCLNLGREVIRMLRDLKIVAARNPGDTAYAKRTITYPGGSFDLWVVEDPNLSKVLERAATESYRVDTATPPSTLN